MQVPVACMMPTHVGCMPPYACRCSSQPPMRMTGFTWPGALACTPCRGQASLCSSLKSSTPAAPREVGPRFSSAAEPRRTNARESPAHQLITFCSMHVYMPLRRARAHALAPMHSQKHARTTHALLHVPRYNHPIAQWAELVANASERILPTVHRVMAVRSLLAPRHAPVNSHPPHSHTFSLHATRPIMQAP